MKSSPLIGLISACRKQLFSQGAPEMDPHNFADASQGISRCLVEVAIGFVDDGHIYTVLRVLGPDMFRFFLNSYSFESLGLDSI